MNEFWDVIILGNKSKVFRCREKYSRYKQKKFVYLLPFWLRMITSRHKCFVVIWVPSPYQASSIIIFLYSLGKFLYYLASIWVFSNPKFHMESIGKKVLWVQSRLFYVRILPKPAYFFLRNSGYKYAIWWFKIIVIEVIALFNAL